MRSSGFTLLEVLAALIILATVFTALIHLHSLSLRTLSHSRDLFRAVLRLELFLSGEPVKGVKEEGHTLKVKGITFQEKIYRVREGNETAYFRIYRRK